MPQAMTLKQRRRYHRNKGWLKTTGGMMLQGCAMALGKADKEMLGLKTSRQNGLGTEGGSH